ncbi:MAG: replication-relaxation family protein [Stackebrandtia sp.]
MGLPRHTLPTSGDIASIINRLTDRDQAIITILGDHRLLSTHQLARAFFPSPERARVRLCALHRLGVLTRFRPPRPTGTHPYLYCLEHVGACLYASAREKPWPKRASIAEVTARLAANAKTAHLLGVNDFFTRIMATARARDDAHLASWLNEQQAGEACGQAVRPDAAAVYVEGEQRLSMWFEHDTGTEPLSILESKLDRYATLLHRPGRPPRPVVFALTSPARERHLHERLADREFPMRVATCHASTATDPTGACWWLLHGAARVRLIEVATPIPPPGINGWGTR